VSYYGRSYPQQWTDAGAVTPKLINASLFGVDLKSGWHTGAHLSRASSALFVTSGFSRLQPDVRRGWLKPAPTNGTTAAPVRAC
jgi:hypothetical protein